MSDRNRIAHLGLYDTLADWEVGHLLAELRSGRFTGVKFDIIAVAESRDPITTMGGVRMLPDALIDELDPADSDLLILPGADIWDTGGGQPFVAAAMYLATTGYRGGDRYVDERAVVDNGLITAGPQSPVQFACAVLGHLDLASARTLEAYERLFDRGDASAFPVLAEAQSG